MFLKGDFHIHTTASDGKYTPENILEFAKNANIDILAITDHDTTASTKKAISIGNKLNIKVIPGIELSTLHNEESIHVLGYFKDNSYENKEFQDFLSEIQNYRVIRAKKITENLNTYFNIKLNYESILKEAKNVIARPHLARAIINAGYNYTYEYIFNNILNKESPAYIPNKKVTVEEGIKLLKSVNATVVLAHPVLIKKTPVEDFIKFDFDGIEAIYPMNTETDTEKLLALAKKYNKIVTAGSDFHTDDSGDTKHGRIGSIYLNTNDIKLFLEK
ncbi:PHP domain-containing protein [Clostridium felsineum]|uniref:5'-3' exoribonuclease n=1 Tax=Clostridium felsineum TaxID=36839 RepID=A0A1S8MB27_9CLOT|nr:PHP domain-containing protein [Clostridium felsineum]URZ06027.1 5'-3' exoribonuclease [Clostridium felsineum]URZ11064.1 5'-3' exoribonuclease [Clostridium felsineum]